MPGTRRNPQPETIPAEVASAEPSDTSSTDSEPVSDEDSALPSPKHQEEKPLPPPGFPWTFLGGLLVAIAVSVAVTSTVAKIEHAEYTHTWLGLATRAIYTDGVECWTDLPFVVNVWTARKQWETLLPQLREEARYRWVAPYLRWCWAHVLPWYGNPLVYAVWAAAGLTFAACISAAVYGVQRVVHAFGECHRA